jgi:hypothetical protein
MGYEALHEPAHVRMIFDDQHTDTLSGRDDIVAVRGRA